MGIIDSLDKRTPPPVGQQSRMYAGSKVSRLTSGWGMSDTSEDAELSSSLRTMRQRSRALVRDAAYAKRAKTVVINNVVGPGMGVQAQVTNSRGELVDSVNSDIERVWKKWCRADHCHTGGSMHFSELERAICGQVFEAGEVFLRKHYRPFGNSDVPYALELIEAERIADQFQPHALQDGARVRLGVETDSFHRPVAYWIRTLHPGELRLTAKQTAKVERVPADQIIHLRIIDRWPQTRAIPWMHAVARKLNDMDGYSEAEIVAARGAASYMGIIESTDPTLQYDGSDDEANEIVLEPGIVEQLGPGKRMNFLAPNRPNANMDPFMRMMLREVAAGVGCSYESLSRDYSKSNYSSSRLALLDDRDLWRMLQLWFIRSFREEVHRDWIGQAVLARAIPTVSVQSYAANPDNFETARFKPRGWSWVDPTKEVAALKEAVRCGFTTVTQVVALTGAGLDIEDVAKERRRELDMFAGKGLQFDTDPGAAQSPAAPVEPDADDSETPAPARWAAWED